jgi:hypothetical protein
MNFLKFRTTCLPFSLRKHVSKNGCFINILQCMEVHELPFHENMDESMFAPINVDS